MKRKKSFLLITGILILTGVIASIIYPGILIFRNKSDFWNRYYSHMQTTTLESIVIKDIDLDGEAIKHVSATFQGNRFEVYVRSPEHPKLIALLFTGRRTGKEAMFYLKKIFRDCMIIAMDYPFENKRYTFFEGLKSFSTGRRGLLTLTTVAGKFLTIITHGMNISNIPVVSAGVSFGAPFAYQLAALDKRIDGIIYCYGFSNLREMLTFHLKHNFENYPLRFLAGWLFDVLFYPLEPDRNKRENKKKPILFLRASSDEDVPPQFIVPFANYHMDKEVKIVEGKHFRPGDQKQLDEVSRTISGWLREKLVF